MKKLLAFATLAAVFAVIPSSALAHPKGVEKLVQGPTSGTTSADLGAGTATGRGTAWLSHIGRGRYTLEGTFVFLTPTTVSVSGTHSLVTPNGDRLFGTFTGTIDQIVLNESSRSTLVLTVTGGTGRFKHATGTLTSVAVGVVISSDPAAGTFVSRDTGTISGKLRFPRSHHGHRCGGRHP